MSVWVGKCYSSHLLGMQCPPDLARQLRRADNFIRLGVVAGYETIREVREKGDFAADEYGLFLGSAFGTMETNFDVLGRLVTGESASPILFSHSVFNAAAGYMASIFNIQGCALTVTDFSLPFFRALEQGYLAILAGRLEYCLVLQVETYSHLLMDAKVKSKNNNAELWQPGVVCWLLQRERGNSSDGFLLESLSVDSTAIDPDGYLHFREELQINNEQFICTDPLAGAICLTDKIEAAEHVTGLECRVDAKHGTVRLILRR